MAFAVRQAEGAARAADGNFEAISSSVAALQLLLDGMPPHGAPLPASPARLGHSTDHGHVWGATLHWGL